MHIFYDFETSDTDFLGQILSYYFVLVDNTYTPIKEYKGLIQPNRMELPNFNAIHVNGLNLEDCLKNGQSEWDAARGIYQFLQHITNEYGSVSLVGYNSAKFDIIHYEKLLLKYGLNPSFFGKIQSLDVLEFTRYCAHCHPTTFPLNLAINDSGEPYYSFRLEDMARAFDCLTAPQTHDAKDDVLLTIELTKALEALTGHSLTTFHNTMYRAADLAQEALSTHQVLHESKLIPSDSGPVVSTKPWMVIGACNHTKRGPTSFVLLDPHEYHAIETLETMDQLAYPVTRYWNTRKKYMNVSCHPLSEADQPIQQHPLVQRLQHHAPQYYDIFSNTDDVEYQPWSIVSFSHKDNWFNYLSQWIHELQKDPHQYDALIQTWKGMRSSHPQKANHMITLFNRFYLNHHPNPNPAHIQQYIQKRYINGTMYRNMASHMLPHTNLTLATEWLNDHPTTHPFHSAITAYLNYTRQFIEHYILKTS